MIRGVHTMFYSSQPAELRDFLRHKLKFPFTDVGEGWLIFEMPSADMGVHPTDDASDPAGTHAISFFCDDIQGTVADLEEKGVEFTQGIEDHGFGWATFFRMPGGVTVQLYEPHYKKNPSQATD